MKPMSISQALAWMTTIDRFAAGAWGGNEERAKYLRELLFTHPHLLPDEFARQCK